MSNPEQDQYSAEAIQSSLVQAVDALLDPEIDRASPPIKQLTTIWIHGIRASETTTRDIGGEHIGATVTRKSSWTAFCGRRIATGTSYSIDFHEPTGIGPDGEPVLRYDSVRFVKGQLSKHGAGEMLRAQKRLNMATAHHLALTEPLEIIDPLLEPSVSTQSPLANDVTSY